MKFYWFNKKCCVPECFNSSTEGEGCYKEFFDLPAQPQSRARWLNAILSGDGENLKICEDHFKDDDVFRDKNHRKKLRLNSIPSIKLPQNICSTCLGFKRPLQSSDDFEAKMCQCLPTTTAAVVHPVSPEKRTRLIWTCKEKRTLFKAIKKHGDLKVVNSQIRINWDNVFNSWRKYGCFGNEKELKSTWQSLRIRAVKVYKNEIYGSKLERKVSKFLYGMGPKLNRLRSAHGKNAETHFALNPVNMEIGTSDDEFNEEQTVATITTQDQKQEFLTDNTNENPHQDGFLSDNCNNNLDTCLDEMHEEEAKVDVSNILVAKEEEAYTGNQSYTESEDEYYSIEDVKNKLGIKIAPKLSEVISLLSSDESDPE